MAGLPTTLRTGIDLLDQEHARLLDLEQQIAGFCTKPDEPCESCAPPSRSECNASIAELLADLMRFTTEHFRHEESLMADLPAPVVRAHKFEHAEIVRRLPALVARYRTQKVLTRPSELSGIVTHWLLQHIEHWDVPLARQITMTAGTA